MRVRGKIARKFNISSIEEEPRKLEYRLPFTSVQEIGRELAEMADCPFEYMYVGGTHSPESEKLPKIDSDLDFFCFRPEFSGVGTPEEWGKYAVFLDDPLRDRKLKPLEKKAGREIHYSVLPVIPDKKRFKTLAKL